MTKAFIVGCGKIAGGFNHTDESAVLTHALAYRRLGAKITGCVDRSEAQAVQFAARWQVPHHGSDLAAVLQAAAPEVVSICTPPEGRAEALEIILRSPSVKAVLIEKPLASNAAEARKLRDLAKQVKMPLLVNYFRAFDPFYQKLEAEFQAGVFGRFCSGTTRYYGAAEATASHGLERLFALLGSKAGIRHLGGTAASPFFELDFAGSSIQFLPSPGSDFSPFELDLLFERCRLRIVDSERRVEFYQSRPDPLFAGFNTLAPQNLWDGLVPSHESVLHAVQAALTAAQSGGEGWQDLLDRAVAVTESLEQLQ